MGYFSTHRARHGASSDMGCDFWEQRGVADDDAGRGAEVWFIEDPAWQPGRSRRRGDGFPAKDRISRNRCRAISQHAFGNRLIALT